jgi:hypothetical protein
MIDVLLNALVPIFAVMTLGYVAGWIREIDNHHVAELNALVMDFALPASLFVATASTSRTLLVAQWSLLLVFTVSMLALYALSYWMQRRLFGLGSSEASVQAITIALPNYAAAGLPLIAAVYGPSDTIYVALSMPPARSCCRRRRSPSSRPTGRDRRISAQCCRPSSAPCASRSCSHRSRAWCSRCSQSPSRRLSAVPFS